MNRIIVAILAAAGLACAADTAHAQQGASTPAQVACAPGAKLQYVCGITRPEDLVQIPDSDWIVVSSLTDPNRAGSGGLTLLNGRTRTATRLSLSSAAKPRAPYGACPGPLDPNRFSAHGLSIVRAGRDRATLFVVGHGAREAIEVFDIDARKPTPTIVWAGCVMGPGGSMNSVTALGDGRLVATEFTRPPLTIADALVGKATGAVYVWKPGGAFEKLPGTDLPGANGVEISPDRRHLFVAVTGTSSIRRYDLADTTRPAQVLQTDFRTDNLRWAPDGRLLLAGPGREAGCTPSPEKTCAQVAVVAALDPQDLKLTELLRAPPEPAFPGISSALIVGRTLWLGSYQSDRVAWVEMAR